MIIYPAIDLRGGRCVRLRQGDFAAETVFATDPVEVARRWATEGAQWLHIVNLDGALGQSGAENLSALGRILGAVDLPVQFGGGLRTLADVEGLFADGVARVILGTVAIKHPEVVQEALVRYGPDRVSVGIDAREGRVAIQGWLEVAELSAVDLGQRMEALGVRRVIYTDVGRDGMLSGVNVDASVHLAQAARLKVIASGGVGTLEDIRVLKQHEAEGIEGVIIGMALYRETIQLTQALVLAQGG